MMFNDYSMLVRARQQEIARELQIRLLLREVHATRRPGRITRSLVQAFGRLGTVLVTVGRRLEGYAYPTPSQSDGLRTAGRPDLNLVSERGVRGG
jgi:hypothetical protein